MTFSSNSLWTTKVYINRINFILHHFSCFHNSGRIISTKLSNYWFILRTSAEMIPFEIFSSGHHLRVKHRSICKISSISPTQQSEGKFWLLNHWCTNIKRVFKPRNLIVVLLLIHIKEILPFYEEQSV